MEASNHECAQEKANSKTQGVRHAYESKPLQKTYQALDQMSEDGLASRDEMEVDGLDDDTLYSVHDLFEKFGELFDHPFKPENFDKIERTMDKLTFLLAAETAQSGRWTRSEKYYKAYDKFVHGEVRHYPAQSSTVAVPRIIDMVVSFTMLIMVCKYRISMGYTLKEILDESGYSLPLPSRPLMDELFTSSPFVSPDPRASDGDHSAEEKEEEDQEEKTPDEAKVDTEAEAKAKAIGQPGKYRPTRAAAIGRKLEPIWKKVSGLAYPCVLANCGRRYANRWASRWTSWRATTSRT